jgi:dTDP-4-dehydrorhamnose 3,5-epimerase
MPSVSTEIVGAVLLSADVHADDRGWLQRAFDWRVHGKLLPEPLKWVQENQLRSRQRVIRGFHFRSDSCEWKLLRVVHGWAFDVIVDIRPQSSTFLKWESFLLKDDDHKHLLIPAGCAHAIQALTDPLDFCFATSATYDSALDKGFAWNDPMLNVPWPLTPPILSQRDAAAVSLSEMFPRFDAWFGDVGL